MDVPSKKTIKKVTRTNDIRSYGNTGIREYGNTGIRDARRMIGSKCSVVV